jgi:peptidoglycan/LPS O-acetylase OafA/YrhL
MTLRAHSSNSPKLTVGVLYGFRALMVLFVCNYHFWQQGWLLQQVTVFGTVVSFDFFTRSSYLFVDGMLLLSGFLLYLPHAQAAEYGTPVPSFKEFYWKRFMRIIPSYLASILILFFFVALPGRAYQTAAAGAMDILTHLTFTFTFFPNTYLYTPLNGVLWTISVEVQFYLLFPLLVRFMRKKPVLTLTVMSAAGILFRAIIGFSTSHLSLLVNQMPSFLDVYALGMLGAILYIRMRSLAENKAVKTAMSVLSVPLFVLAVIALLAIFRFQSVQSTISIIALHQSQWIVRLPLALTILVAMLSAAFLPRILQKPLDNRLMRFFAVISLNLYIWHQVLSARVVKPFFPDTLHDDPILQGIYTLLCFTLSILTAMAFTYGLEHPAAKWIQRLRNKKGERNHERPAAAKAE